MGRQRVLKKRQFFSQDYRKHNAGNLARCDLFKVYKCYSWFAALISSGCSSNGQETRKNIQSKPCYV